MKPAAQVKLEAAVLQLAEVYEAADIRAIVDHIMTIHEAHLEIDSLFEGYEGED